MDINRSPALSTLFLASHCPATRDRETRSDRSQKIIIAFWWKNAPDNNLDGEDKEMKEISRIKTILTISICFIACSTEVERSMLIGTYEANYKKIQSTLILREDGTYDCHLVTEDGEKLFNSNNWLFDEQLGRPHITFYNFDFDIDIIPEEAVEKTNITLGMPISTDYKGQIELIINEDVGLYYLKQ
jgi:hypothetical protein